MTEARELFEKVIKNDYCIGCGACASIKDSPFKIKMNEFGNIVAYPVKNLDESEVKVLSICPFSNEAKNEDEISEIFFPGINIKDNKIGKYLSCYAGYVKEGDFRKKGSSGGFGKWIGYVLLKEEKIDFFVQVVSNQSKDQNKALFDYAISSHPDDAITGSKSSYYPVSLVEIINIIKEKQGRYAITGVPCFIKALRLLALQDEILKTRIKYTIGIVCGGMKSANQSKMIGWQLGVKPENLTGIDFRRKYKDKPANNKIYQVWSGIDNIERYRNSGLLYATDWGAGFFKPNACDFCDDVVGETADVSIGDAWLPKFVTDPDGTSIIVIRNNDIAETINKYRDNNSVVLHNLTAEEIGKSQEGGFLQRRNALSYRIAAKEHSESWYPKKRVKAHDFEASGKNKLLYELRDHITKQSHISFLNALNKNDLTVFYKDMDPLVHKYTQVYYGSYPVRKFKSLKRKFIHILRNKFHVNI